MRILLVVSILCCTLQAESMGYVFRKLSIASEQKEATQWSDIHEKCKCNDVKNSIRNLKQDSTEEEKKHVEELVKNYFFEVKKIIYGNDKYSHVILRFLDAEQQSVLLEYLKKCQEIGIQPDQAVVSIDM